MIFWGQAKSTGPIQMFLRVLDLQKEITVVTHDSVLPKEDVDNSHVLLPGVVVVVLQVYREIHKV